MHIVAAHTEFPLYWPPRWERLAASLLARGDRLTVVEIAGKSGHYDFAPSSVMDDRWHVLFPGGRPDRLAPARMARALFRSLDDLCPDIVLAGGIAFPSGATAVRWCRRRRRAVVIMDDIRTVEVPRSWLVNAVKRRVYRNVDAVLVPAPSHDDSYAFWGVPRCRIFHGLNAIDNDWFGRRVDAIRATSKPVEGPNPSTARFFLGVGRQNPNKNWMCVLRAYALYRSRTPSPLELVLVGDGPSRHDLQDYASRAVGKDVRFVGFVGQEELCTYYACAAALLLASYKETWSQVVNEAMASGLPVLLTRNAGSATTLLHEGENGWTFDPNDPEELARHMLALTQLSEERRRQMGQRSREIISHWGLDRFVQGALAAIDAVKDVRRGFASPLDRCILALWKGRYRPL